MRSVPTLYPLGLLVGLALGVGCSDLLTSHCANMAGDQTCADRGMGSFCSTCTVEADGCTDMRPADDCYFAGLGEESDTSHPNSTGSDGAITADETTPEPSAGPQPCVDDEDCGDAAAPFCGPSGECVACAETVDPDGACAGLDPTVPLCMNGGCVQCTAEVPDACSGETPVCDDASNSCTACNQHDQCGEAACNFYTGACLPADAVVHVGPGQELGNLTDAVASFGSGAAGTIIVHQDVYYDTVIVNGGQALAFLANEGDMDIPVWDNDILQLGTSPLTVTDGTVFIDGLELTGTSDAAPGLAVNGGRAWVDRSHIVNNKGGGIVADSAANLTLRNCFVDSDGNDANALVIADASASVLYSTLVAGRNNAVALSCTPPTTVVVRNSLIVARGDAGSNAFDVVCDQADMTFTVTESHVSGRGNVTVEFPENAPGDWFMDYVNGDFHLQNAGLVVFAAIARWRTGDPLTDIDGAPRPNVDGSADYVGADVP